jgi:hypothetical protein
VLVQEWGNAGFVPSNPCPVTISTLNEYTDCIWHRELIWPPWKGEKRKHPEDTFDVDAFFAVAKALKYIPCLSLALMPEAHTNASQEHRNRKAAWRR